MNRRVTTDLNTPLLTAATIGHGRPGMRPVFWVSSAVPAGPGDA